MILNYKNFNKAQKNHYLQDNKSIYLYNIFKIDFIIKKSYYIFTYFHKYYS